MSVGLEIIIYLLLILGTLIITITFFDKQSIKKDYYIRKKNKDSYVKLQMKLKGISQDDADRIRNILEQGKYENIYNIVDNFSVISKNN